MNSPSTLHRAGEQDEPLRVGFADLWGGEDQRDRLTTLLTGRTTSVLDDVSSAEMVLCSVFGNRHLAAKGMLVGFSLEPTVVPGKVDFSIDCRHHPDPSHLRIPPWAFLAMIDQGAQYQPSPIDDGPGRRFCNFIYSNPRCPTRNAFFEALHQRRPVDALGSLYHNRDDERLSARRAIHWRTSKIDVLREYRFTIAFENTEMLGYTTEKMVDAWLADSIPIYWGNPAHAVDFPSGSYLSLYEAGSMTRLIEQVFEAEHSPERCAELRANNPFRTGHAQQVLDRYRTDLAEFVEVICAEALQRRTRPAPGPIDNAKHTAQVLRRRVLRRVRKLIVP